MIESSVPERPSLNPYFFTFTMKKTNDNLTWHWSQLHTGNATDDDRNHAPFYSSFTTIGKLKDGMLVDMQLIPESTNIQYLKTPFNNQDFSNEDITGRMAKPKHLGKYSTKTEWSKITDEKFPQQTLYELTELDGGFGAPRHLLCGAVDAKMSYIFTLKRAT